MVQNLFDIMRFISKTYELNSSWLVGRLVCWLCLTSHRQRGHLETAPHLLSLAKDVKLGFYTVATGNRTLGRCMAVHYTTAAPRQLHLNSNIHNK